MTGFNIVNLKQGIGLPGASKKLQKGNTGKEHGQLMPFACIIGHECRIATQKTEKTLLNFSPGKGKQNNILGAGKDKTEKTNQSLPVKGKGLAESPHGVILKGGATKDINLFMSASKGKDGVGGQRSELARRQSGGVRGQRSDVKGQKAEMEEKQGLLKFNLKNAAAVKGKSAVEPAGTEKNTEKNSFTPVNSGGKNNIGNLLKPLGLNGEETIKISHKGTLQPEAASDRGFSAGGHNTTFHVSNNSSAVNESASSYNIKPSALINQIANGAKMSGRVRIALNPPSLGTLDMDVIVRNNKVHVILQVENNDVRQILQSNLESLKSSLRNQGLVADTINVSVQEKSDGANHGADYRSGQSETLFKESKNREGNEEDQEGGQDSLNHDPTLLEEENQGDRSGEHGERISLFA